MAIEGDVCGVEALVWSCVNQPKRPGIGSILVVGGNTAVAAGEVERNFVGEAEAAARPRVRAKLASVVVRLERAVEGVAGLEEEVAGVVVKEIGGMGSSAKNIVCAMAGPQGRKKVARDGVVAVNSHTLSGEGAE